MSDDGPPADRYELLEWIEREMRSTIRMNVTVPVGTREHYEPNPAHGVSEGSLWPSAGDRIIVTETIYGEEERTVRNDSRAVRAADKLVELVLEDESLMGVARALMPNDWIFRGHWQAIYVGATRKSTKRIAAKKLGIALSDRISGSMRRFVSNVLPTLGYVVFGVFFHGGLILWLLPDSRPGKWIAGAAAGIWKMLIAFIDRW